MPDGAATLWHVLTSLLDLMLPATCPGCRRAAAVALCRDCAAAFRAARPRVVRPEPPPPGLPPCHAVGRYAGLLRDLILGYKERGRYRLAAPLAERLAAAVSAAVPGRHPVLLVPVPATARAVRQRRGDHMLRLARRAVESHRRQGRPAAVFRAVRVRDRPDSAGLTAAQRAAVAGTALRPRTGIGAALARLDGVPKGGKSGVSGAPAIVVVDDVMTTGATVAATCHVLASAGVQVTGAAVLAATERRHRHPL